MVGEGPIVSLNPLGAQEFEISAHRALGRLVATFGESGTQLGLGAGLPCEQEGSQDLTTFTCFTHGWFLSLMPAL